MTQLIPNINSQILMLIFQKILFIERLLYIVKAKNWR